MSKDYRKVLALNLKRFRKERKLSQALLADRADVSVPCVKKIEGGKVDRPESATLAALAYALNISIGDLYRPPKTLTSVRFRAQTSLRQDARDYVVSSCANWLERYCYLEDLLDQRSDFSLTPANHSATVVLPDYAAQIRKQLGFSEGEPIANVADVLSKSGIKFWFSNEYPGKKIFGLAISESPQATGIVVFNAPDVSVERRIFSTIHELGHLLLHANSFDANLVHEDKKEEKEADTFAGYFLMPQQEFLKRWQETEGISFVNRVLIVKRFFRVSYKTILYRLVAEGLENVSVHKLFPTVYKRTFGKDLKNHREPVPLHKFDVPADRFRRLVYEATRTEKISFSKAAEFLGMSVPELYETFLSGEVE